MNKRDDAKVSAITQVACLILVTCVGVLGCNALVFGQQSDEQSSTRTEAWNGAGQGGKKVTTETKWKDGSVRVVTQLLDPKGNVRSYTEKLTQPNRETAETSHNYDSDGNVSYVTHRRTNSSGKVETELAEYYEDGLLKKGYAYYYDETGQVKSYREFDPATQTYEEKEFKSPNNVGSPTPASKPSPSKTSQDEAVSEAWWQFFTNDKEGLDNLKMAIGLSDPEDRAAVEKWLNAEKATGEQADKVRKAHAAIDKARGKLSEAEKVAREAKPGDKAAADRKVAKARNELYESEKKAKEEETKARQVNDALEAAKKGVDPGIRDLVKKLGEGELEKTKQERVEEKSNGTKTGTGTNDKTGSSSTKPAGAGGAKMTCREAMEKVSLAQARDRINRHIAHIEARKQLMRDHYYYSGAAQTLASAFRDAGIADPLNDAQSWGPGSITPVWKDSGQQFYDNHLDALKGSLKVIEERGYATKGELAYLDSGMQGWDAEDEKIQSQFLELVNTFVDKGKVSAEKAQFMKEYYEKYDQLWHEKPYPSNKIAALSEKAAVANKSFDDRYKQIEDRDEKRIQEEIKRLGGQQLLSVVKKTPSCE